MNSTIRLRNLFIHILTLWMCTGISSCNNGPDEIKDPPFNKSSLVGEWKAVEIEATDINGKVSTYTDPEIIENELENMYWIDVTEDYIHPKNSNPWNVTPYELIDNCIIFEGEDGLVSYELISVTNTEMIIRYTGTWISLITYNKIVKEPIDKRDYNISGKIEKGPFIRGSSVSIEVLDSKLRGTGNVYNTEVTDNFGSYSYECNNFTESYVEIKANGYYYNEKQDSISRGTITLKALADLSKGSNININILTHLKAARIKRLVSSGMDFNSANEQAQRELLDAFGLGSIIKNDVSSISMASGTNEAAALIAISSLILMDRSNAELTEYIATLSADFGETGFFTDAIKEQIKDDTYNLARNLSSIKENLTNKYQHLGKNVNINDLFHFIDWNSDGIVGNEVLKEGENVIVEPSIIDIPIEGGSFTVRITSPIRVYLKPQVATSFNGALNFGGIFDSTTRASTSKASDNNKIKYECLIDEHDNSLHINVATLEYGAAQNEKIELYDYVGNVVATVELRPQANPARIGFHVANQNLSYFDVYGTSKESNSNTKTLFEGTEIIRNSSYEWDYKHENDVKYWMPSTEYNFAAIINATKVTTENGLPSLIHFTSDGDTDLLYTELNNVYTNESGMPTSGVLEETYVYFYDFQSLMSNIQLEFKNYTANILTCKVSNIRINGVKTKGIYDVNAETWKYDGEETTNLYLGNATNSTEPNAPATYIEYGSSATSNYTCKIIPGTQDITITYDYELYNGTIMVNQQINNSLTVGNIPFTTKHLTKLSLEVGTSNVSTVITPLLRY